MIDSFEASSQNATVEEQMQRANVWTDLLHGTVPEDRLQDSFRRAFQLHSSAFPVNAYEIKTAWAMIDAEEKQAAYRQMQRDLQENPVKYCESRNHINDDGDIEVYLGVPPNGKEVIVPCDRCRPSAFHTRYQEERMKFITEQPEMKSIMQKSIGETVLEMLAQAKAKTRERPTPRTPLSILTRAMLDGGDTEKITRIKDYVRKQSS